jgi:hypothetical protein
MARSAKKDMHKSKIVDGSGVETIESIPPKLPVATQSIEVMPEYGRFILPVLPVSENTKFSIPP